MVECLCGFKESPQAGSWKRDTPGEQHGHRVSLSPVGSMLTAHCCCRIKMPFFLCAMPIPLLEPERRGVQLCPHPASLGRA